jgi:hypothetical protein
MRLACFVYALVCSTILSAVLPGPGAAQTPRKPRVFVTDSDSWEFSGGFGANKNGAAGSIRGGARPQTAEIVKTFGERCPDCVVTTRQDRADYVVVLEHEGGKSFIHRDNKFAVFDRNGDAIESGSTRSLGNAVKDACVAIARNEASGGRTTP